MSWLETEFPWLVEIPLRKPTFQRASYMITDTIPPPDAYRYDGKQPALGYSPPFPEYFCYKLREKIKDMGGYKAASQRLGLHERALRDATEGKELVRPIRDQLTQVINGS